MGYGNSLSASVALAAVTALAAPGTATAQVPWGSASTLGSGTSPSGVRIVDLNHDGLNDAAVTFNSADGLVGYLDSGVGSFSASTLAAPGASYTTLTIDDLDQDGTTDVIVGDSAGGWTMFANDGAGVFSSSATGLGAADGIVTMDGDRDGDIDLYCASSVAVAPGWKGVFQSGNPGTTPTGALLVTAEVNEDHYDLASADLDLDGDDDLVYASETRIRVLLNNRTDTTDVTGDFVNGGDLGALDEARDVAVADLDGDGDPDILASSSGGSGDAVVWYANTGTGSFGAAQTLSSGASDVNQLTTGDIDADGDIDVIVARATGVELLENLGDGATWASWTVGTLADVADVTVGDLDDDGDLDIAAVSSSAGTAVWFENLTVHGSVSWGSETTIATSVTSPQPGALADLDLDGDLDIIGVSDQGSSGESFYRLNLVGDGSSWGPEVQISANVNTARDAKVADFDEDGALDVLSVGNTGTGALRWSANRLRDGSTFATFETVTSESTTRQAIAVDFDQDGDIDVIRGRNNGGDVWWDRNNSGPGTNWTACLAFNWGANAVNDVAVGDIDGDGDLDIVAAYNGNPNQQGVKWLQHTPDGGCGSFTEIDVSTDGALASIGALELGDMDNDGDVDIVVESSAGLSVFINPGAPTAIGGGWSSNPIFGTGGNRATLADVDRDGDLDVLQTGNNVLYVHENDGFAATWTNVSVGVGGAASVRGGDIDGDGVVDAFYERGNNAYAWRKLLLQQASATTSDVAPASIEEESGDAVLGITVDHTLGRAGDVDIELGTLELFLHDGVGTPLSDADAANVFGSIEIWRDDGDGVAGGAGDTLLTDVSSFTLSTGVLTLSLPDGDGVAFGGTGDYLVVANIAGTAIASGFTTAGIDHLPSDGILLEHEGSAAPIRRDGSPAGVSGVSFTIDPLDSDNDGDPDTSDCDDLNATTYNGAPETCDGVDNDCDSSTDEDFDVDGDGAFDEGDSGCVATYGAAAVDCDDANGTVNPSATELCDGIDNDCDGSSDEGFDTDSDNVTTCGPDGIPGTADDDCDDTDITAFPGATETCDFVDSDCDGSLVDEFTDTDSDLQPDCTDLDDDNDGDPDSTDCNDTDATIYAGAPESCDNIDSNCNNSLIDTFTNSDSDVLPDCIDLDDDDDGMPDTCEDANGLDPLDPSDAALDPDGDGRSNLVECHLGTDLAVYEGPDEPLNELPLDGEVVVTNAPNLEISNATSPLGDPLTYTFEVYEDAALTALVTSVSGVASGTNTTSWAVSPPLSDDDVVYWRAAASDAYVMGPWSAATSFTVDTEGDGPTVPELVFPVLGMTMRAGEETLRWEESTSPEGLDLEYDVQLYDAAGLTLLSSAEVVGDAEGDGESWLIDVPLDVETLYSWRVRSRDPAGRTSDFTDREVFGYETDNAAPTSPSFISPQDGDDLGTTQPEFRIAAAVDPEGGVVTHLLELDTAPSFASADLIDDLVPAPGGTGEVFLSLEDEGLSLTENTTWYARISARDVEEQSATPDTISFFVRGGNEPPPVPELVSPQENEVTDGTPTLVVTTVPDPEGDVVTYEFVVGDTRDLAGVPGVSSGTREWQVDRTLAGGYWWTVRAVDSQGARSDWAEPRYGLAVDPTWGSCSAAGQGSPHLLWLLLPLGLLIRRRR